MRAAVLTRYGATPEVGTFDREPVADDGQQLIAVSAAGLNPNDLARASGTFYGGRPPLPSVPGREGAGRLADGRRVYFDLPPAPFGSLAERTVAADDRILPIPDGVSDGLAIGLGVAGLAAWLAFTHVARLAPGERVLVLGASGSVGQVAVQAAKLLGAAHVVAAARSEERLARARELGADETVRLDGEELAARLGEAAGDGFDVVIDPVWGAPVAAALTASRRGARIVQLGEAAGAETVVPAALVRGRQLAIVGHSIDAVPRPKVADAYAEMTDHAAAGRLTLDVETVPLAELPRAWEAQAGSPHRKLVVEI